MTNSNKLVNINEAAKILGVSKLTLRKWDNSGALKAIRIGNRKDRRYKKEDLDKISKKESPSKEVDIKLLKEYIDKNEFWIQEGPGLPITVELAMRQLVEFGDNFGHNLKICLIPEEKDYIKQALSIPESIENCKVQFKLLKERPKQMEKFLEECKKSFLRLASTLNRLEFIELEEISNKELLKEFDKLNESLENFWHYSLYAEPYDPFLDRVYFPKFSKIIKDKKKAREIFSLLTFPSEPSFITNEHRDLVEIVVKYLRNAKDRKILFEMSSPDYLAHTKSNKIPLFNALRKHQEEYFWIQNSYGELTNLKIPDFLEFIKETLKESTITELEKEFSKLRNQKEEVIEKQKNLYVKLKLSRETIKEIEHIKTTATIKDERKEIVLKMLSHLFRFLKEFEKRTGVNYRLIGHARIEEIPKILEKDFDTNTLDRRRASGIMVAENGGGMSNFIENNAKTIKNALFKEHAKNSPSRELRGNVASKGGKEKIFGTAKIILEPKDKEIKSSEILITSMTRPDFVPLMRKALAVVTDEGGITCHAAIVSREMNKPCIIGTKNSSRVIKDGDKLELGMNHGVVKVLKKDAYNK